MSEPSSLYLRLTLTEAALEAYKRSRPQPPRAYSDWQGWLATAHFNGSIGDDRIATSEFPTDKTCGDYINLWVDSPVSIPGSRYDAVTQTWTLIIASCSENYFEFIEILSVLRSVDRYKNLPDEGFILIWPYFWGGAPEAYLVIDQGSSRLELNIPPAAVTEADAQIKVLHDAIMGSYPADL